MLASDQTQGSSSSCPNAVGPLTLWGCQRDLWSFLSATWDRHIYCCKFVQVRCVNSVLFPPCLLAVCSRSRSVASQLSAQGSSPVWPRFQQLGGHVGQPGQHGAKTHAAAAAGELSLGLLLAAWACLLIFHFELQYIGVRHLGRIGSNQTAASALLFLCSDTVERVVATCKCRCDCMCTVIVICNGPFVVGVQLLCLLLLCSCCIYRLS